jgi:Host cell surface-exposed lipoprotein
MTGTDRKVLVFAIGAVFALVLVSVIVAITGSPQKPAAAVSSATPTPTTPTPTETAQPPATDGELVEWCQDAISDLTTGVDLVTKFSEHPDGKGLKAEDFRSAAQALTEDKQGAPVFLRAAMQDQVDPLNQIAESMETGVNRTIDFERYKKSGSLVADECKKAYDRVGGTGAEEPTEEPTEPEMTASQEQAVEAAQEYLDSGGYSEKGLIDQLSSEYGSDFPKKDAKFAVNYLKPNWKAEAVEAGQEYLDSGSYSKQGLIEQLESPYGSQFTHGQAVYAANKVY